MTKKIYVAHITAYDPAANGGSGGEITLYVSSGRDVPSPTVHYRLIDDNGTDRYVLDDLTGDLLFVADVGSGDAEYLPRLKDPGNFDQYIFDQGRTSGLSDSASGDVIIANADGALDGWLNYGFDGQTITIYRGEKGQQLSEFSTFLVGKIQQIHFTLSKGQPSIIRLAIMDRWADLQQPIQTTRYAGTNSGSSGFEGTPDDIQGLVKPLAYGYIHHARAIPVNNVSLTYQLHDGPINSVATVWDKGAEVTKDTAIGTSGDFANSTLLLAATITAGKYATCLAEGYIRLASTPVGDITARFEGDKTGGTYSSTVAGIIKKVVKDQMGYTDDDLDLASFTALDSDRSWEVGIFIELDSDASTPISELCDSYSAFAIFDDEGKFSVGLFGDLSGTAVRTISQRDYFDIDKLPTEDTDEGLPAKRTVTQYAKNYFVQTKNSLAAGVTATDLAFFENLFRTTEPEDIAGVVTKHKYAQEITRTTLLKEEADADTLNAELATRYGTERFRYSVTIQTDETLQINDLVNLQISRYGLSAGKKFIILGRVEMAALNRTMLDLWG